VTTGYIHTCYGLLDPGKSADFYVNKLVRWAAGEASALLSEEGSGG
jgi:hypothetical protein